MLTFINCHLIYRPWLLFHFSQTRRVTTRISAIYTMQSRQPQRLHALGSCVINHRLHSRSDMKMALKSQQRRMAPADMNSNWNHVIMLPFVRSDDISSRRSNRIGRRCRTPNAISAMRVVQVGTAELCCNYFYANRYWQLLNRPANQPFNH